MSQIIKRPAAEVVVDVELVRALIRTQHPDLSELPLEEVAAGWDNFIFRLGATMAVRLPRRLASVAGLEHEQRWLSTIARHLPIPVPAPLRIGKPDVTYSWPWSIVPWLTGEPADLAPLKADQAKPLARFLRALHLAAPGAAPKNPSRGVPLQQRARSVEERMDRLAQKTSLINPIVRRARESAIEEYGSVSAATWSRALGWVINLASLLFETGLAEDSRHTRIGELTLQRIVEGPH